MLGLWGATALVTGGMVGAGILILPSIMAQYGSWSIFGWLLAATLSYFIAIMFGRLAKTFKGANPVEFIGQVMGPNVGYLVGWGYFIAMCASGAAIAGAIGDYSIPVIGDFSVPASTIGMVCLVALFAINTFNHGSSTAILIVLTVLKIVFFSLIGFSCLPFAASYKPIFGAPVGILKSASLAMFAFVGLELASLSSGNVKNPEKNVMLSTKLGVIFASIAFIGTHCAVLFTLPDPASSVRPVYDAATILFGSVGALALGWVAVLGCIGSLNGSMIVQSSTVQTLAKSGWINQRFAETTKQGFPWRGSLLALAIIFLFTIDPQIKQSLLFVVNALIGIVYILSCIVDMKKNGVDIYNILAMLGSSILLYNCDHFILILLGAIYGLGYLFKLVAGPSRIHHKK